MASHSKGALGRDFAAEYAARKQRGLLRGLSVSQSRGHAGRGESSIANLRSLDLLNLTGNARRDMTRTRAYKALAIYSQQPPGQKSLARAAQQAGVSPATVRRYGVQSGALQRIPFYRRTESGAMLPTNRTQEYRVHAQGTAPVAAVGASDIIGFQSFDRENLSILGHYWNDVKNGVSLMRYRGVVIHDLEGNAYHLETDLNRVRALTNALPDGEDSLDAMWHSEGRALGAVA